MVNFDDLSEVFNSQDVALEIAATIGAGQVDYEEIITIDDVEESIDNPTTRKNTRGGPIDFFAHAIIEYVCTARVTKKVRDRIRSLSKQNTRSALQTQSFRVNALNIGGVGGDDTLIPFDAQVRTYRSSARPTGDWDIAFTLRIFNTTFT